MASINVQQKKRGRPATGKTPIVGVRLPDDVRGALDAFIAKMDEPRPNQSEVIRRILRDWAADKGLLDK